jgi:hypothetical protein
VCWTVPASLTCCNTSDAWLTLRKGHMKGCCHSPDLLIAQAQQRSVTQSLAHATRSIAQPHVACHSSNTGVCTSTITGSIKEVNVTVEYGHVQRCHLRQCLTIHNGLQQQVTHHSSPQGSIIRLPSATAVNHSQLRQRDLPTARLCQYGDQGQCAQFWSPCTSEPEPQACSVHALGFCCVVCCACITTALPSPCAVVDAVITSLTCRLIYPHATAHCACAAWRPFAVSHLAACASNLLYYILL